MIEKVKNLKKRIDPLLEKMEHDNIFAIAGQSAFFLILTVFPLAMFGVSVLQNLHIPVETFENILGQVLNETTSGYVSEFLSNVYKDASGISLITFLATLWSAAQGMHVITNGLNRVHNTYENRNWFLLRLKAIMLTVVFFAILLGSMLVIVLGSTISELLMPYIRLVPDIVKLIFRFRYFILYVYLIYLFALLYKNVPNLEKDVRREYGIRNQLPGAIICATAWFVLSLGISVYVDDWGGFSVYGSLTRMAVIMVWLYLCLISLMFGAEVNIVYHEQIKNFRFRKHKAKIQKIEQNEPS
ncbi:MAG: YihY/virulence factor BrkB family protein [Clostridia bacterium]|nr:YihY/virulence factor BrkB family protein [Clostridia bacterium]